MTDIDRLRAALDKRYTIVREVGAGGMATVYLAEDARHHRKVAIKVLRSELSVSLGAQRFHREIEVAAQLQHPNILPLLDSGEADGFLYYVMPFVEGESLRARLANHGELPVHEAVRILIEVVDALAEAHSKGVVHRDIKPDNLLLSGRHALVTDFGVAKAVSEATGRHTLTSIGVALGTPTYMAPEQATADPNLDHRVDIYAVGALAYELLSGRPPFTGRSPQEILAAHVTTQPEPVSKVRATIPAALNDVVMKCLEKRPADRWQSAAELLSQLEPLMTPGVGITPTQTRPFSAVLRAPSRSRAFWFATGALVIAATAFATTMLPSRDAGLALGRAQPLAFETALELDPALSPDGKHVAYASGTLTRMRIYVRQQGGRAIPVTSDSGVFQRGPKWSPDGTQLLFVENDRLVVAPAFGGVSRPVMGRGSTGYAWSPDGTRFAFVNGDKLFVRSIEGGEPQEIAQGETLSGVAWSPDGQYIAFVSGDNRFTSGGIQYFGNIAPTQVRVVRADGSAPPVSVTDNQSLNVSPAWLPDGRGLLYVSNPDGPRDVYSVRFSGGKRRGEARRLTSGLNPHSISLSRDGARIAYSAYTARSNVWGVRLRPGGVATMADARQITTGNQLIEAATISADGKSLLYDSDRDGSVDIYRISMEGGEPQRLTTDPAPEFNPSESPDGRWVTFHSFKYGQRDVFVIPHDGGEMIRLTSDSAHDQQPRWMADGNAIIFFRHGQGRRAQAYVVERSSGGWSEARPLADSTDVREPVPYKPGLVLTWKQNAPTLEIRTLDGRVTGSYYTFGPNHHVHGWSASRDGSFNYRTYERDGGSTFWRIARAGVDPVLIARLNDPLRPATRNEFDTDGRFLYTTITDRQSDVFVAELSRKR